MLFEKISLCVYYLLGKPRTKFNILNDVIEDDISIKYYNDIVQIGLIGSQITQIFLKYICLIKNLN